MAGLSFKRLSNRALAASGGKCRCGPLGRRDIKIYRKCKVLFPYSTREKSFCAVRGSGSGEGGTSDSMRNLFVPWLESGKGNPKTTGFWRRFCILLPPRAKGCRAGARKIPAGGIKGTSSGPSRTPAPTGCVYLGAPVFGKPPIWAQQSHCTITDRRVSAWYAGAAAGMGVQAIRCTVISIYFGFRGVHGGVL